MDEVTMRRAAVDDLEALVGLRIAMQRDLGELGDEDEAPVRAAVRCYLAEKLESDELVVLLAETVGGVVGTGWIVLFRKPPSSGNLAGVEGYILSMYTAPQWRGRGIASRIVDELLAVAGDAGVPLVWLRAAAAGRRVYERAGFGENPRYMQVKL